MVKIKIAFETKKGHKVETLWGIMQSTPYPDFEAQCGSIRWRNCGGLIPQYGGEFTGIGHNYYCYLLRSDKEEHDLSTRVSSAGYREYPESDHQPNPGTFEYRGVDLGEMSITFENDLTWPRINVRGFNHPTPGEHTFIKENIAKVLASAIECHTDELKAEAIAALRKRIADNIETTKTKLDKLAVEMENAIRKAELLS